MDSDTGRLFIIILAFIMGMLVTRIPFKNYLRSFTKKLIGPEAAEYLETEQGNIRAAEPDEFEQAEQVIIDRVIGLSDVRAGALMTPRTQMTWLDLADSYEHNLEIIADSTHSRFPVARESVDDFVGIIYTRDIIECSLNNTQCDFEKLVRTPLFVPKSMNIFKVLELLKESGMHETMVLDEYGGIVGILTVHDVLEEIVGEMPLVDEDITPQIVLNTDGSWLLDGMLPIDEFKKMFDLELLPEEERDMYHTLGGFIVTHLGYIPVVSEKFTLCDLNLEIIAMDRIRIDKVKVSKKELTAKGA